MICASGAASMVGEQHLQDRSEYVSVHFEIYPLILHRSHNGLKRRKLTDPDLIVGRYSENAACNLAVEVSVGGGTISADSDGGAFT
ncbi:hypothetical protein AWB68_00678 [Caballeronia choica]|uniref:Uncharacterized protein n=1 Tax=Caballeronia choica TaxID=326476 RepID=A0A158FKW8_9BURK|nr:hypothetical protein [Caballeronia choica]SAL19710.1 hypothetical protein AWB68_00678 [Caballeronia choica]